RSIVQLGLKLLHPDLDAPVLAVARVVAAVVPQSVIALDVLLNLLDAQRKVVRIEQRLSAGVGRERVKRLLRVVELAARLRLRPPGIQPAALRAAGRR